MSLVSTWLYKLHKRQLNVIDIHSLTLLKRGWSGGAVVQSERPTYMNNGTLKPKRTNHPLL